MYTPDVAVVEIFVKGWVNLTEPSLVLLSPNIETPNGRCLL